jgi:hypothetical protein
MSKGIESKKLGLGKVLELKQHYNLKKTRETLKKKKRELKLKKWEKKW